MHLLLVVVLWVLYVLVHRPAFSGGIGVTVSQGVGGELFSVAFFHSFWGNVNGLNGFLFPALRRCYDFWPQMSGSGRYP